MTRLREHLQTERSVRSRVLIMICRKGKRVSVEQEQRMSIIENNDGRDVIRYSHRSPFMLRGGEWSATNLVKCAMRKLTFYNAFRSS